VLILTPASSRAADNLAGQASVIDGDTLEIHGTRIRLWGIDAPESSQLCRGEDSLQYRCGMKAANDLDAFLARRSKRLPYSTILRARGNLDRLG
jgi:endonuclease YncB( thermonuclease family)